MWETISEHNLEAFETSMPEYPVEAKKAYRLFRVKLTGGNFSEVYPNVLSFSGK